MYMPIRILFGYLMSGKLLSEDKGGFNNGIECNQYNQPKLSCGWADWAGGPISGEKFNVLMSTITKKNWMGEVPV